MPHYTAFISYSHHDSAWGDWLHRALESYRVPRRLQGTQGRDGPVPARLFPVFRDREELPTSADLDRQIVDALRQSNCLVVICSPNAARSRWVNEEIMNFRRLGREDRILAVIVDGVPNASAMDGSDAIAECFPPALLARLGADGQLGTERIEPLAADARPAGDGRDNARLKVIAGILGVPYESLRRRELEAARRRTRVARSIAAVMLLLALGAAGAAVKALINGNAARRAEQAATRNESISLAALSHVAALNGGYADAVMLALAAWPRTGDANRPPLPQSIAALSAALPEMHERARAAVALKPNRIERATFVGRSDVVVLQPERGPLEVWDTKTWTRLARLGDDADRFWSMAFSPDGKFLAGGMRGGELRRYDLASGKLLNVTAAHTDSITDIAFAADGARLATASNDKSAKIWDAATLKQIVPLAGENEAVLHVRFSPDNASVVTVAVDGTVLSDARTGAMVAKIDRDAFPQSAEFIGSGDRIVATSVGNSPAVSDARSGKTLTTLDDCPLRGVTTAFVSPDRDRFVLLCSNGTGVIHDASTLAKIASIKGPTVANQAAFSWNGKLLATSAWTGKAQVWDLRDGEPVAELSGHTDAIFSVAFSPANDVITASADGTVRSWDATSWASWRPLGLFGGRENALALRNSPALSADGKELSFIGNGNVEVLDIDDLTRHELRSDADTFEFARFSPDRKAVVAIGYTGDLFIFGNLANDTIARIKAKASTAAWSPHGDWIAVGDQQGSVRLLDARTLSLVRVLGQAADDRIVDIDVSPDGKFVAAAAGGAVRVWRVSDATLAVTFGGESNTGIRAIAYSPDGSEIAVTGDVRLPTQVWDAATGQLKFALGDSNNIHRSVRFSPDGHRLVTSMERSARIWDAATGAAIALFGPHRADMLWSSFTADGKSIITASDDGEARIWDASKLEQGDAFQVACRRFPGSVNLDTAARQYGLENLKPICSAGHEPVPFHGTLAAPLQQPTANDFFGKVLSVVEHWLGD